MGKNGGISWCFVYTKSKNTLCPKHFLHLKVKSCISKINLSHVSHSFPLTANYSEGTHCHIKDFQKVVFIPNEKNHIFPKHATLNLKNTYCASSCLMKYNNIFS